MHIDLAVYDYIGKKISHSKQGKLKKGQHSISMDVSALASGIYFLNMQLNEKTKAIKFIKM